MNYLEYPHKYCPYCYEKMPDKTVYYCKKCGRTAPDEKTQYNIDYRGLPMCTCGNGSMQIRCDNPKCREAGNIIPPAETAIVAILGMRSSGKSTYLLDIVNSKSSQTGLIISPKSRELIEWREKGIKAMKNQIGLDSTDPTKINFSSVIGMQPSNSNAEEICFSLTDRPGEEAQDMNKLMGLNYMFCADYIILILDLLNIPGVAGELKSKDVRFTGEAENIMNITEVDNIISVINTQRGKKYGKKIPVFVGISKWDYMEQADLSPIGFSIGCNGADTASLLTAKGKFDPKKLKYNNKIIRNFLIEHDEGDVVNKLENFFKEVNYFAFSSFGTVPQFEGGMEKPPMHSPRHIMDPFYCILHDKRVL